MYEFIAPLVPELYEILASHGVTLTADEHMRTLIAADDVDRARRIIQNFCPGLDFADYDFCPVE